MDNNYRNKVIATNIKKLIKDNKINQKKLANEIGISQSTLSDYLNLRSNPSHGVIQKIADYFNVLKSDIDTTYKDDSDINTIYNQLTSIRQKRVLAYAEQHLTVQEEEKKGDNIIHFNNYSGQELEVNGFLSAGTGETLFDDFAFKMTYKGYIPPHDIALQVNGDSMEPIFENKQIIFVEKTTQIKNGQIGVVIIDGEAYLKKVFINDDNIRLVSLNKKYKDMYFYQNHDVRLVGRVII
ncbi:transcriptional regulator [Staphylococcus xylosus]|nr:transcriptional regulator [Staphylococcus xylosus]